MNWHPSQRDKFSRLLEFANDDAQHYVYDSWAGIAAKIVKVVPAVQDMGLGPLSFWVCKRAITVMAEA